MINKELFELADKLKNVAIEQQKLAKNALNDLPDGETKTALENLLKKASSGKADFQQVQKELNKIVKNAG